MEYQQPAYPPELGASDAAFMREALLEARAAFEEGEVPVGAVMVRDGMVIARAHNTREKDKSALRHAEATAIELAGRRLGGWRLPGCTLYVTLEPCPMCAGAAVNARVPRVVFGAFDRRAGALGTVLDLNALPLNHKVQVTGGVLEDECVRLLQDFFRKKREG